MILVYCSNCGGPTAPSDRYCSSCGTAAVPTPGYVPYLPMAPPSNDRTAMIVVIVIVVVLVSSIGVSALLYVMVSGLITGPTTPIAVGVTVSRSSDGTNWTLTYTAVPSNLNPAVTYLSLTTASGAMAMPQTALSSMGGMGGGMMMLSGGMGSLWVRYSGAMGSMIAAGDTILIGTMTSMGVSTTGFHGQMVFAASVVWSGTLQ